MTDIAKALAHCEKVTVKDKEYYILTTKEDVDALQEEIEDLMEGSAWRYGNGRVDWEDFLWRVEDSLDVDLGSDLNSPMIKRVKAIGLQVMRELRES